MTNAKRINILAGRRQHVEVTVAKVYSVRLNASFYVLAESEAEAELLANVYAPLDVLASDLPITAEPYYSAYAIVANDDYHRQRCVNVADRQPSTSSASPGEK